MPKSRFDVDSYVSELISFLHSRNAKLPEELPVIYPGYRASGPFALPDQVECPAEEMTPKNIMSQILKVNKAGLSNLSIYKETARVTLSKPFQLFLLDSFWWLFLDHCASVDLTRLRRQRESGVMQAQQQAVKMTSGDIHDEATRRNMMSKEELALKGFENDKTEMILRKSYSVKKKMRQRLHATVDDGVRHAHSRVLPQHLFDASDTESVSTNASTHFAGGTFGRQVRRRNEGTFLRGGVRQKNDLGTTGTMCSKIAPDRSETPSVIFRDSQWRRSTLHLALSGAPAARNFEELRDALTSDIVEEYDKQERALREKGIVVGEQSEEEKDKMLRQISQARMNDLLKKSFLDSGSLVVQKYEGSANNSPRSQNINAPHQPASLGDIAIVESHTTFPPLVSPKNDASKNNNNNNSSQEEEAETHSPPIGGSRARRVTLDPKSIEEDLNHRNQSSTTTAALSPIDKQKQKKKITVKENNSLAGQMLLPSESRAFYDYKEDLRAPSGVYGDQNSPTGLDDPEMKALLEDDNKNKNHDSNNDTVNSGKPFETTGGGGGLNDQIDSDEEDVQNNEHFYRTEERLRRKSLLYGKLTATNLKINNTNNNMKNNTTGNNLVINSSVIMQDSNNNKNWNDDDNESVGTDSVLSAASSIRTADDVLRVSQFKESEPRQDLYGLPPDVRRSVVAREQHVLFSRMADRYVEAMNVQNMVFSRQQDRLIRILPDMIAQFMFVVFYKVLPCFRETICTREFQASLFRTVSYFVGGVERECLNPYSWRCHLMLNDGLFQQPQGAHHHSFGATNAEADAKRRKKQQQQPQQKLKNDEPKTTSEGQISGKRLKNTSAQESTTTSTSGALSRKKSTGNALNLKSALANKNTSSLTNSNLSNTKNQEKRESEGESNTADKDQQEEENDEEEDEEGEEGEEEHDEEDQFDQHSNNDLDDLDSNDESVDYDHENEQVEILSSDENNDNVLLQSTNNTSLASPGSSSVLSPKPPAPPSSHQKLSHQSDSEKNPRRGSTHRFSMQSNLSSSVRKQQQQDPTLSSSRKPSSSTAAGGVEQQQQQQKPPLKETTTKATVSFGDFLAQNVQKNIESEASTFQSEMKKSFFQRKQFKTGKGIVESLLMPGSSNNNDDDADNHNDNAAMSSSFNLANSSTSTNVPTTSSGAMKERSHSIKAGAGLRRKSSTKDAIISIDERERRAGTGLSIFANLDEDEANLQNTTSKLSSNNNNSTGALDSNKADFETQRRKSLTSQLDAFLRSKEQQQPNHSKKKSIISSLPSPFKKSSGLSGFGSGGGTTNTSSSSSKHNNNNNNNVVLPKHIQAIKEKLDSKIKSVPWYGKANQRVPNNDTCGAGVTSANFLALELSPLFQRFAATRLSVSDETASTLKDQVLHVHAKDHYRGKSRFSSYPVRPPGELGKTLKTMKWTIISPPKSTNNTVSSNVK